MYNSPYKKITNRKYNTWCKYTTRIDTYGRGCEHNCSYCYAKSLLEFRNNWDSKNAQRSYISEIEKYISVIPKSTVVRLGSMTDCLQPIEKKYNITYETIKLLNQYRLNYLIVTKSCLVSDEKYIKMYDSDLAHFQISISCTDDKKAIEFEECNSPSERIASIEKLSLLGFDVSIRLSPFLFQYSDIRKINTIKCKKILIEFLKVNHFTVKNFNIDYSDYTLNYGGHKNMQLDQKIKIVNMIDGFSQKSVGEYVFDHHNYFSLNVNFNKNDCCNLCIKKLYKDDEQQQLLLN